MPGCQRCHVRLNAPVQGLEVPVRYTLRRCVHSRTRCWQLDLLMYWKHGLQNRSPPLTGRARRQSGEFVSSCTLGAALNVLTQEQIVQVSRLKAFSRVRTTVSMAVCGCPVFEKHQTLCQRDRPGWLRRLGRIMLCSFTNQALAQPELLEGKHGFPTNEQADYTGIKVHIVRFRTYDGHHNGFWRRCVIAQCIDGHSVDGTTGGITSLRARLVRAMAFWSDCIPTTCFTFNGSSIA